MTTKITGACLIEGENIQGKILAAVEAGNIDKKPKRHLRIRQVAKLADGFISYRIGNGHSNCSYGTIYFKNNDLTKMFKSERIQYFIKHSDFLTP